MPPSNSTESIDSSQASSCDDAFFSIECSDRWQVYHRLQALGISCRCAGYQPLKVAAKSPAETFQVWCVVKRVSASRSELVETLNHSWQLPAFK